ncbi:DUF4012 domain-containing protein [Cellulomonas persica]|uniref:DUF4012 domain-containing protein n=1 Tax=Cellulomonas persica TaxID=76861 RepID=A0A510UZT0_9CELL|nr:DUF4012 domain-containing protein [Cellulomonas persica]GEK19051.1 hypothetical protein CPE01_27840 [Cellulomonas persica]
MPTPAAVGEPQAAGDVSDESATPGPRRRGRLVLRVAGVVLLLLVVAVGWLVWRGVQLAGALQDAEDDMGTARAAVDSGDVAALGALVPGLQDAAGRASSATGDPVWRAAEHVPYLGRQLRAASAVSDALDDIATGALPPLVDAAAGLSADALVPRDGQIDVAALRGAAPAVAQANASTAQAVAALDAVDVDGLVPALAERFVPVRDELAVLAARLDEADTALATVPALLGADGPRSYLVLVLNPAELRSAGGIVGSVLELHATDGRLEFGEQRPSRSLARPDGTVLPLTVAERALLGDAPARFMQSVTATPDFARTAELARALWSLDTGRDVDGVLTVDPVVLASLLTVIGPTTTPDGTVLDADNALPTLLSDVYRQLPDGDDSDAYFAAVAQAVTSATLAGGYDGAAMVDALRGAVDDGRVAVWTSDETLMAALRDAGLVHDFLGDDPAASRTAGVFLNDRTVSKMDYYLRTDLVADDLTCGTDGASAQLTLTMTSTAPADAATSLPVYVTGGGVNGVPAGRIATQVLLYAPRDGTLGEVTVSIDGAEPVVVGPQVQVQDGREVGAVDLTLAPGQSATVQVRMSSAAGQDAIGVERTPGLDAGRQGPELRCAG